MMSTCLDVKYSLYLYDADSISFERKDWAEDEIKEFLNGISCNRSITFIFQHLLHLVNRPWSQQIAISVDFSCHFGIQVLNA